MNNSPAGGIVPYVKYNNEYFFLLGNERVSKKWSGFVGGYENSDGNIINTAIREFNEESAKIFEKDLEIIRDKLISGKCFLLAESNRNRLIYVWFVEFSPEVLRSDIENKFLEQVNIMTDSHYKEKTSLRWFNINDIRNSNNRILYKLKKNILDNYKKL
jgi:hypothetical protein